jgi:hypothetical protein
MATSKRRINISVDKETGDFLTSVAKHYKVPVATKAAELLRLGLEIEEDMAWAILAEERMKNKGKLVPHKLAWK